MQDAKKVACLLVCQMFGEGEQQCGLRLNAWSVSGGGNAWDVFSITDQLDASVSLSWANVMKWKRCVERRETNSPFV